MRKFIISPHYLNGLLRKHKNQINLVNAFVTSKSLTPEKDQAIANFHFIDPDQKFVNIRYISGVLEPIPHRIGTRDQFFNHLIEQGIDINRPIILFDKSVYVASRLWWHMRYYDLKNIFILDGGFDHWQVHKNDHMDQVKVPRYEFEPLKANKIDYEQILQFIHNHEDQRVLIDSRTPKDYEAGHIPKAINVPWYAMLDPRTFMYKCEEEIHKTFEQYGVDLEKEIIVSCQTGKSATAVTVALELIGKPSQLYDGSYLDYAIQQYKSTI